MHLQMQVISLIMATACGIDAGFFSGSVNLQGNSNPFIYNSLPVVTKTFLDKKATISLVANDPETKYHKSNSTTATPQFYESTFFPEPLPDVRRQV